MSDATLTPVRPENARPPRRLQFNLKTLFWLLLFCSVPVAWYGYRQRAFDRECHAVYGTWRRVDAQGDPILWKGSPIVEAWTRENCVIDPTQEPKHIDFVGPKGTLAGIYRWQGDKIQLRIAWRNCRRPISLDDDEKAFWSEMFMERIPDRSQPAK